MSLLANSLRFLVLAAFVTVAACSPAPEEDVNPLAPEPDEPAASPVDDEPAPLAEPVTEAMPETGEGEPGEAEIDRSISDATEFGDDAMLEGLVPTGWKQAGPIEHYNVATLYNKINGRSELYMAYDVLGLSWVSFVKEDSADDFLDLFIYDMRTPTNAFGIYSVEREPGQEPVGLGRMSYRTGSNLYFWQGKYYGYINASRESEGNTETAKGVLTALMPRLEDTGEEVSGIDLLPKDGLIEDTIQYFKVDAMSLDFLNNTWAGQYDLGDATVRAFISQRDSEEEAEGIQAQFAEYGASYAESTEEVTVDSVTVIVSDWGGSFFDAAFHVGPAFAGVSNVEGRETLDAAVASLIKQLKARG